MSHASSILLSLMALGLGVLVFRFASFIGFHLLKMAAGIVLLVFISVLVLPVNMQRDLIDLIREVAPDVQRLLQSIHLPF